MGSHENPTAMNDRFDSLVEAVIEMLPASVRAVLDRIPVVVMDRPTPDMLRDLEIGPEDPNAADEICGLHTGVPETDRGIELAGSEMLSQIHLFRVGIVSLAGGWDAENADEKIREEIRVTLLHELGHEFGLDEDDLDDLGYG